MDFTPKDMEAVQACLEGIDRNVSVAVKPAAAVLLMPNTVRTPCRSGLPSSSDWYGAVIFQHACALGCEGTTCPSA